MKAVVIIGDGMSDLPVDALGGKTPLMVAKTPAMDTIARRGVCGLFQTIPSKVPPGSETANLTILGYDPRLCLEGRGVLEAASLGVPIRDGEIALRANLVTIEEGRLVSHAGGHIPSEEASILIQDLSHHLSDWPIHLTPGLDYRHLLVVEGGDPNLTCFPPHEHIGEPIESLRIRPNRASAAETAELLNRLVEASHDFLRGHPLNLTRRARGEKPANALWPWSPGRRPKMTPLTERFGIRGAVISAVDLVKGIAVYAGLEVIHVPGATGRADTNYEGKAQAAITALADHDLVYVHVEAPDEAGHDRDLSLKIRTIEDLDQRLIRHVLTYVEESPYPITLAVLPDHPTPISTGKHGRDPVPVAIMAADLEADGVTRFDESSVRHGALGILEGDAFIRFILQRHSIPSFG